MPFLPVPTLISDSFLLKHVISPLFAVRPNAASPSALHMNQFPFTSTKCNICKEMEMLLLCSQSRMMLSFQVYLSSTWHSGDFSKYWKK